MRYRRLDENHDFRFGQGRNDYLVDIDACGQAIETRLRLFLGEWWEDITDGLPMWQSFLGATLARRESKDKLVQERVLGTPHVTNIESFTSQSNSTRNSYEAQVVVNTDYGQLVVTNQGDYQNLISR